MWRLNEIIYVKPALAQYLTHQVLKNVSVKKNKRLTSKERVCLTRTVLPLKPMVRTQIAKSPRNQALQLAILRSVLPSLWYRPFILLLTEAALKATSRVGTPALIFYLTQQAPCLVYKLILYSFQVSHKKEPENSFLQDCWILSCIIEFVFVEAEIGDREVTERNSFSPPNFVCTCFKVSLL